jgi:hypothetical protein
MKIRKLIQLCCALVLFSGFFDLNRIASAEENQQSGIIRNIKEMPVLTGDVWQFMSSDAKVAFVWGIGHVATIERQMTELHPELHREGFSAKLAEGLVGVPMNSIILEIDTYYKKNQDDLKAPVMEVIWDEIVKPKIKTGIANQPLN